jgi:hypothetical protein
MLTLVPRYRFANAPTELLYEGYHPTAIRQQHLRNRGYINKVRLRGLTENIAFCSLRRQALNY